MCYSSGTSNSVNNNQHFRITPVTFPTGFFLVQTGHFDNHCQRCGEFLEHFWGSFDPFWLLAVGKHSLTPTCTNHEEGFWQFLAKLYCSWLLSWGPKVPAKSCGQNTQKLTQNLTNLWQQRGLKICQKCNRTVVSGWCKIWCFERKTPRQIPPGNVQNQGKIATTSNNRAVKIWVCWLLFTELLVPEL